MCEQLLEHPLQNLIVFSPFLHAKDDTKEIVCLWMCVCSSYNFFVVGIYIAQNKQNIQWVNGCWAFI